MNTSSSKEEEMLTSNIKIYRPLSINENVIKLQQIWSLCGIGLQTQEAFMLSCALQKLQQHTSLKNVRFWGKIFGIYKNYYIAEAKLNKSEINKRLSLMKNEIIERMIPINLEGENIKYLNNLINSKKLIPGNNFQHLPENEIKDFIKESQKLIPKPKIINKFDIPPEPIGVGLNSCTFFVVNSLTDDWIELPSVTPRQICDSKNITKYLKGDLEADVISYPYFHGKEKHYLRTLIARIAASTCIAPNNYYKKVAKNKHSDDDVDNNKDDDDEEEEESEEEEEEEEESTDNEDFEKGSNQMKGIFLYKNEITN